MPLWLKFPVKIFKNLAVLDQAFTYTTRGPACALFLATHEAYPYVKRIVSRADRRAPQ